MRPDPEKRTRIFHFLQQFIAQNRYAPSVSDIQKGCHISSPAVVQHHLNMLEKQGVISRASNIARGISVVSSSHAEVEVPLLGTIAAGEPIPVPTEEAWRSPSVETVPVTQTLIGNSPRTYALRVKGTSMIDALIDDGDIVLIEPASTVTDGEMAVVWLKDQQEATLKKIYRERGRIRLQPANCHMEPVFQEPDNVQIQGRVIGLVRKMGATG